MPNHDDIREPLADTELATSGQQICVYEYITACLMFLLSTISGSFLLFASAHLVVLAY